MLATPQRHPRDEVSAVLCGDFTAMPSEASLRWLLGWSVAGDRSTLWTDAWADAVATDGSDPAGVTSGPGNPWAAHTAKIVAVKRSDLLPTDGSTTSWCAATN